MDSSICVLICGKAIMWKEKKSYVVMEKLRRLRRDLKKWSRENFDDLDKKAEKAFTKLKQLG